MSNAARQMRQMPRQSAKLFGADDALCRDQDRRSTGYSVDPPHPRSGSPAAHPDGQYDPQLCCASLGISLPIGIEAVTAFAKRHLDGDHPDMPEIANGMLGIQCYQFIGLNERSRGYSKMIEQHALLSADARRLMRMPGLGQSRHRPLSPRSAMQNNSAPGAICGLAGADPAQQIQRRQGALGKITKKGDRYIRKLLVVGMTSRAVMAKRSPEKVDLWTAKIIARQAIPIGTTAMANKAAAIHLGDAHKETGISAASVLTAPTAYEMQDVEVMMRN